MTQVEGRPFDITTATDNELDIYLERSADWAAGLDEQPAAETQKAVDALHAHEAKFLGNTGVNGISLDSGCI